jgi:3-deoxy-D-manno-octulosonic-acid transferase
MILTLYRAAAIIGAPVIRVLLSRRRQRGKEDSTRFNERFGQPSRPRPAGALAWIHAASVGEAISALCLIDRLRQERPALTLLVTTGTVTSAKIMADRLPGGTLHQYAPIDHPHWIDRFLRHWQPDLALWMESEFWPNTLSALAANQIPVILINARISPKSYRGWQRLRGLIRTLLNNFSLCLAQSTEDGEKLTALGAPKVRVPGNLKYAAAALPVSKDDLQDLKRMIGNRPVWAAVSTHPGEDDIIIEAHDTLLQALPDLLTIIVPRHPIRGADIADQVRSEGQIRFAQRTASDLITADTSLYIVDTVGELGLVYRLVEIAFIGGSLVPHGGQNLLEAAKLDCAIIHGPWMTNFTAIVDEMRQASALAEVSNATELVTAVTTLMGDKDLRNHRIAAASDVARKKDGILDEVLGELAPYLDAVAPRQAPEIAPANVHAQP